MCLCFPAVLVPVEVEVLNYGGGTTGRPTRPTIRAWKGRVFKTVTLLKMIWNCRQADHACEPCPCRPRGWEQGATGGRCGRCRGLTWAGAQGTCWCRGTVPVSLPCETFARGCYLSSIPLWEVLGRPGRASLLPHGSCCTRRLSHDGTVLYVAGRMHLRCTVAVLRGLGRARRRREGC